MFFLFLRFTSPDLQKLCIVLKNAVAVPVHGESTPYILPTMPDVVLTHLQDGVLHSMELLQKVYNLFHYQNFFFKFNINKIVFRKH